MFTFRRLVIYVLLLVPVAYFMGVPFLQRRIWNYKLLAYTFVPIFALHLLHRAAVRTSPAYARFVERHGRRLARIRAFLLRFVFFALLFVPTMVFLPIGAGLAPKAYAALTALFVVGLIMQRRLKDRYPAWLRLDVPLMMLIYIYSAFVAGTILFFGSSDGTCKQVESNPYLIPIVTRADIEAAPDIESCFPYDIKTDPDADMLFFTLKQKRAGFIKKFGPPKVPNDAICATRLSNPKLDASMMIPIAGKHAATWPQRIAVDEVNKRIYVVTLDVDGNHAITVVSYDGGFEQVDSIAMDFEPIRAYADNERNRLIVLGCEGDIGLYDLDTYERYLFRRLDGLGFIGMIDTLAYNPEKNAYYVGVVSENFLMVDAENFNTIIRRKIRVPTIGLDYDQRTNRVYAAGTLTREVLVLDGDTLNIVERIKTGTTVRELYIHRRLGLIVTAGYTDGHLDFYDLGTHERLARIFVGKLARGIHIEQRSGRVFVASSCGLFEVNMSKLFPGRSPKEAESSVERR